MPPRTIGAITPDTRLLDQWGNQGMDRELEVAGWFLRAGTATVTWQPQAMPTIWTFKQGGPNQPLRVVSNGPNSFWKTSLAGWIRTRNFDKSTSTKPNEGKFGANTSRRPRRVEFSKSFSAIQARQADQPENGLKKGQGGKRKR